MTSQDFVQGSSKSSQESNNSSPQSSQDSKGKSKARSPSQDLFDDLEDEDFSELFSQISPTASKDEVDEPLYVSPPKRESSLDESASVPVKDNKRGREESDDDERLEPPSPKRHRAKVKGYQSPLKKNKMDLGSIMAPEPSGSGSRTYRLPSQGMKIDISAPVTCRVTFKDKGVTILGSLDDDKKDKSARPSSSKTTVTTRTIQDTVDLTREDENDHELQAALAASIMEMKNKDLKGKGTEDQLLTTDMPLSRASSPPASQVSTAFTVPGPTPNPSSNTTTTTPGAGKQHEPLSEFTCPICFSPPTNATLTPCGHICCGECLFTAVAAGIQRALSAPGALIGGVGGGGRINNVRGLRMGGIDGTGAGAMTPPDAARCPVCRAVLKGWDGRGSGVTGLKLKTKLKTKTVISI